MNSSHHHHHSDHTDNGTHHHHTFIENDPVIDEELKDIVKITHEKIETEKINKLVESTKAGAISTFLGVTRDHHAGKKVTKLEYEAYEPMALSELKKICDAIRKKWSVIHIAIYHRIGEVPITETSVIVSVSSIHRRDSLEACHFGIDEIKASVPIWKKEFYEDGSTWKENQEFRDRHKC